MTQAPSTQPASDPKKKYNNKNRLISGEYQMKSYLDIRSVAAHNVHEADRIG